MHTPIPTFSDLSNLQKFCFFRQSCVIKEIDILFPQLYILELSFRFPYVSYIPLLLSGTLINILFLFLYRSQALFALDTSSSVKNT